MVGGSEGEDRGWTHRAVGGSRGGGEEGEEAGVDGGCGGRWRAAGLRQRGGVARPRPASSSGADSAGDGTANCSNRFFLLYLLCGFDNIVQIVCHNVSLTFPGEFRFLLYILSGDDATIILIFC
jgi:hypothetical protein